MDTGRAALTVLLGLGIGFTLVIWLSNKIGHKGPLKKMALNADLEKAVSSPNLTQLIGKEGTAATVLRPSGKVSIEGELYDGVSESGFIEKGTPIRERASLCNQPINESMRSVYRQYIYRSRHIPSLP